MPTDLTSPLRVVVWGTGNVGRAAVGAVLDLPYLELAGVVVHDPAKDGVDAGELCGRGPTGVRATRDVDAALAGADVLCYTATGDLRPAEAIEDMCRALRAGVDVVSSSVVQLLHPPSAPDQAMVAAVREACEAGGTSCFTSGIDPGFGNDLLPMTLLGVCSRVDAVHVQEVLDYSTYEVAQVLFDVMGFGGPLDRTPLILLPGVLTGAWGCAVQLLAEGLGVELEEVREVHERVAADRDIEVCGRTVEAGTQAGMRFSLEGIVGGEPRIVVEHVTRIAADVAPLWPTLGSGHGGYRVTVTGNPSAVLELEMTGEDGDANTAGMVVTAMRLLASAPAVRAAAPGLLTVLDLPLQAGRGAMSSAR